MKRRWRDTKVLNRQNSRIGIRIEIFSALHTPVDFPSMNFSSRKKSEWKGFSSTTSFITINLARDKESPWRRIYFYSPMEMMEVFRTHLVKMVECGVMKLTQVDKVYLQWVHGTLSTSYWFFLILILETTNFGKVIKILGESTANTWVSACKRIYLTTCHWAQNPKVVVWKV